MHALALARSTIPRQNDARSKANRPAVTLPFVRPFSRGSTTAAVDGWFIDEQR